MESKGQVHGDRRSIATRNRKWAQAATVWLASRKVPPNAISISAIMLNALPMWRKNCGPHALADLRRKLQEEKSIFIIFPEGGRSRDGSMKPFKHGLGMLVAETNVPVVPCGFVGAFEALSPDRKLPRPAAIKLVIGDAFEFASTANDRTGWSQIAARVESSVRALVAQSRTA